MRSWHTSYYSATSVAAAPSVSRLFSIALLFVGFVGTQTHITHAGTWGIVNCDGYGRAGGNPDARVECGDVRDVLFWT